MEYLLKDLVPYLHGLGWFSEQNLNLFRFPLEILEHLPTHLRLNAEMPTGVRLRFRTRAETIILDLKHISGNDHVSMSRLAQCGFELYVDGVFQDTFVPTGVPGPYLGYVMVDPAEEHDFEIYFPARAKIDFNALELEFEAEDTEPELKPYSKPYAIQDPIIFYGSSITHGSSAPRPSLNYPAMVARQLNADFINLGFGGSGKGEPIVTDLIASLPRVSCYVMDWGINLNGDSQVHLIHERYDAMIQKLKKSHPETPILIINVQDWPKRWDEESLRSREILRAEIERVYKKEVAEGNTKIAYIAGEELLGTPTNWDLVADHTHPNQWGFARYADLVVTKIKELLERP